MIRETCARLIGHPLFERAIMVLIVLNAIVLGLETSDAAMAAVGGLLLTIDTIILWIFVAELVARLVVDFRGFWRDPWRIFDFLVVAIALVPATGSLAVLRAFRVLRVLRLVSNIPAMRRVVSGLLGALPGMGSVVFLLLIIFYVFAVICTKLYGDAFPQWFGSIGASFYTLFQVMTLESWSMGIVRPVMDEFPLSWMLFIPFILATAFTVLNLFIGVIVDAMQTQHEVDAQGERQALQQESETILAEVRALRAEMKAMREERR